MDAMERLMQGRTTFMIAHRLLTLESCDLRLHVDDGRAVSVPALPRSHEPAPSDPSTERVLGGH